MYWLPLLLSTQIANPPTIEPPPPNIVLILTDDMGWSDLGCYGSKINSTPTLDQLANEGVIFTQCYAANSVCTPSRAGLLTGCFPHRVGLPGAALWYDAKEGLNTKYPTLSSELKKLDYSTAAVGKWHLGSKEKYMPLAHGFDSFTGIPYSNSMWSLRDDGSNEKFPPLPYYVDSLIVDSIDTHEKMNNLTTRLTKSALHFIDKNANKKPFFLYLAHPQPHVPLACLDSFKNKSKNGLYSDVMMELDWSTHEILNALKRHQIESNTIVIFTSDNGPWLNYGNHAGRCDGLREGKGTCFEGGFRVPFIIKFHKKIKSHRIENQMISHLDLFPTLLYYAGKEIRQKELIDGLNLASFLEGKTKQTPRKSFSYIINGHPLATTNGIFKTIVAHTYRSYEEGKIGTNGKSGSTTAKETPAAKYNLSLDIGEKNNLLKNKSF